MTNIIEITNASVQFNLASGHVTGLKEYVIKFLKNDLMFEEFFALKNINLKIKRGESWALLGNNGSGKSTLLKLISGILKPATGSVKTHGTIAPLIELGAGFEPDLTARENIFLNSALMGYKKKFTMDKFDEIVDFSELHDFLDIPIKNFSSGMSARLGFAIATIKKPDILIIDEVLSVGDFSFQEKCHKKINQLLDDGTTLLFVSHTMKQVKEICQKAIWLDKGELKMQADVDSVATNYLPMTESLVGLK